MGKDQVMGLIVFLGSIVTLFALFYLIFLSPWTIITIMISMFIAAAAVLMVVAWIGYTMATTPTPTPLESLANPDEEA